MAVRVTEAEVKEIIQTGNDSAGNDLWSDAFIAVATALTDKVESNDSESLLNTALLTQIEKYLAAHFYALTDPQYKSNSNLGASAAYDGATAMGLDYTRWGQMAKRLDLTGFLVKLDQPQRPKARMFWGGTDWYDSHEVAG